MISSSNNFTTNPNKDIQATFPFPEDTRYSAETIALSNDDQVAVVYSLIDEKALFSWSVADFQQKAKSLGTYKFRQVKLAFAENALFCMHDGYLSHVNEQKLTSIRAHESHAALEIKGKNALTMGSLSSNSEIEINLWDLETFQNTYNCSTDAQEKNYAFLLDAKQPEVFITIQTGHDSQSTTVCLWDSRSNDPCILDKKLPEAINILDAALISNGVKPIIATRTLDSQTLDISDTSPLNFGNLLGNQSIKESHGAYARYDGRIVSTYNQSIAISTKSELQLAPPLSLDPVTQEDRFLQVYEVQSQNSNGNSSLVPKTSIEYKREIIRDNNETTFGAVMAMNQNYMATTGRDSKGQKNLFVIKV